jgi:hypothetical protein
MVERDEKELPELMETLGQAAARLLAELDARTARKRNNVVRICPFSNDEFGQPEWWEE